MDISYTNGMVVKNAVIQIWDDLSNGCSGYYRAFWTADRLDSCGSPIVGYCSPGGSYRTIRETVTDALRRYPSSEVYRNGRRIS